MTDREVSIVNVDLQAKIGILSREALNVRQLNAITVEGLHQGPLNATDAVNARTLVDLKANVGIRNILHKNVLGTTPAAHQATPFHLRSVEAGNITYRKASC